MKGKIFDLFLIILAVLLILSEGVHLTTGRARIFDYRVMIVVSGSMEPVIKPGRFIVGKTVSPDEISPGDIVAYRKMSGIIPKTIVHRVIAVTPGGFIFKGDNNLYADREVVKDEQILYRIVRY